MENPGEPAVKAFVDQPAAWSGISRCVIVRGWGFVSGQKPAQAVRLCISGHVIAGVVGFPRPDVKLSCPDAPDNDTGFEIRGILPGGTHPFSIELQSADGRWSKIFEATASVKTNRLPRWLGGGQWEDLMFFQMPAHAVHGPRILQPERFPPAAPTRLKFTIVTPSFNQRKFLPQTMAGVTKQAGINCEYIVQDGGSTDGSADYIASHAGQLHAWESRRDKGQSDAIATAFAKTTGQPDDLMAWINSDDFYLPGALAFVADHFARHPDVDVIYGHRIVVDENSQEIGRWFLPKHQPDVLRLNDFVPQETLFWRRRIWDKTGGLNPTFQFAMDWDLLLRFQAAGARIARVPYFLACFRIHAAQKTSARMHDVGQREITLLRERTHQRPFPPQELEQNPVLLHYLRRSAWIEFLWRKLGLRSA